MTITEITAQMGVTPETLVQEAVAQGTATATVFVVLGALAIVLAVVVFVVGTYHGSKFCIPTAELLVLIGIIAFLLFVPDLIAWKTAPETTANQYIVEHYGGGQNEENNFNSAGSYDGSAVFWVRWLRSRG